MKTRTWNLLFTLILTIAAIVWGIAIVTSTLQYRPAYRQPQEQGYPMPVLVSRVVLVILDGLRYDVSQTMPALQNLRQIGAEAQSIVALPSMSQATWTTLISGAQPEINGAVLFNAADAAIQPIQVDHLFQLAKQTGLTTALAGALWWEKMVPTEYLNKVHYTQTWDEQGDREAALAATEFLKDPDINFLLLYQAEYDEASDTHGARSQAALQATEHLNRNLETLLSQIDLSNTLLIVTADHGQRDQGGHGGDDKIVLQVPFIMAGPRVRTGSYPAIQQSDIAVTISALLGLPSPRSNQGRIIYEFLDVSDAERAHGQAALVTQRSSQADAYLWSIQAAALPTSLHTETSHLDSLLKQEKFSEVDRQANVILAQIAQRVGRARTARINQGRLAKLPIALVAMTLIVILGVLNWHNGQRLALLLSPLGIIAYHVFWLVRGQAFSLSTLGIAAGPGYLAISLIGGALIALLLGPLILWLWSLIRHRRQESTTIALKPAIYAYTSGLVSILWLQALVAAIGNGALGSWNIVVPTFAFLFAFSLIQAALVGLLVLSVAGGLFVIRRTRRAKQPQPTPA